MTFVYTSTNGCNANSSDPAFNVEALTTNDLAQSVHVNELRRAVEDWYTNHGKVASPVWSDTQDRSLEDNIVRRANLNELRVAINKVRNTIHMCDCNSFCDCTGHNFCSSFLFVGCGCVCSCNQVNTWMSSLSSFVFSNTGMSGSISASSNKNNTFIVNNNTIEELRTQISLINNATSFGANKQLSDYGSYNAPVRAAGSLSF